MPLFLTLDGVDGTGKSTQGRLLAEWMRGQGRPVVECIDPGGTVLGDELRAIILDNRRTMSPACEAFLFMASRSELVRQIIHPALQSGSDVISDRFLLATVVYQGHAGGLAVDDLWAMGQVATGGLSPDLTFVLDLPTEAALRRRGRQADRMEAKGTEFLEKVRQGFLLESRRQPNVVVIDASGDVNDIQARIRSVLTPLLAR